MGRVLHKGYDWRTATRSLTCRPTSPLSSMASPAPATSIFGRPSSPMRGRPQLRLSSSLERTTRSARCRTTTRCSSLRPAITGPRPAQTNSSICDGSTRPARPSKNLEHHASPVATSVITFHSWIVRKDYHGERDVRCPHLGRDDEPVTGVRHHRLDARLAATPIGAPMFDQKRQRDRDDDDNDDAEEADSSRKSTRMDRRRDRR